MISHPSTQGLQSCEGGQPKKPRAQKTRKKSPAVLGASGLPAQWEGRKRDGTGHNQLCSLLELCPGTCRQPGRVDGTELAWASGKWCWRHKVQRCVREGGGGPGTHTEAGVREGTHVSPHTLTLTRTLTLALHTPLKAPAFPWSLPRTVTPMAQAIKTCGFVGKDTGWDGKSEGTRTLGEASSSDPQTLRQMPDGCPVPPCWLDWDHYCFRRNWSS